MIEIEEKLNYKFKNRTLLTMALTHSSYANENRSRGACNERLEFLGDSILGFIVADYLYRAFPELPEGKMTKLRADLVCEKSLASVADRLGLGDSLLLGKGEEKGGGRMRASILADATEALLAALYLDGGPEEPKRVIYEYILNGFSAEEHAASDYKTQLQEFIQQDAGHVLSYAEIGESGPDHDKLFTVAALLDGKELARGEGKTKKQAEQNAAKTALEKLG